MTPLEKLCEEYADRLVGEGALERRYDANASSLFCEAILAERERCAKIAEAKAQEYLSPKQIAEAIRARQ